MEMILLICQNGTTANDTELEMAKARLQMIFASEPVHARRLVYHAASIIAISRDCTVYTPCEIMRVFDAYAYVLAFVKYGPRNGRDSELIQESETLTLGTSTTVSGTPSNEVGQSNGYIRLDQVPWSRSLPQQNLVELWISGNRGFPAIDGVQNICTQTSFAQLKSSALQAIESLSLWNLSRKFHKTLDSLE